jgi:hypothetical protein
MPEYPLVTNAIPLYKSARFVDIITENIQNIRYPNIEIIISDRHCFDDAIDVLMDRFQDDQRIIFLKSQDALTYAQHYNLLLSLGKGKYFRWMPHDDSYPVCCLKEKVEILESNPGCVLVHGPWRNLDNAGNVLEVKCPVQSKLGKWSYETSVFVAFGDYHAHAFKGLFRREVAISHRIWLYDTKHIISPERCWEYAMSLTGPFHFYKDFEYYKRYPTGSTHQTWQQKWRPIDFFFMIFYKLKHHWTIDRKPLRLITFVVLMFPLALRQLILYHTPSRYRTMVRAFPGKVVKRGIRRYLAGI